MVKQTWVKYDDNWFYINKRGRMAVDTHVLYKGKYYYVNNKGVLQGELRKNKNIRSISK